MQVGRLCLPSLDIEAEPLDRHSCALPGSEEYLVKLIWCKFEPSPPAPLPRGGRGEQVKEDGGEGSQGISGPAFGLPPLPLWERGEGG